MVDKLNSLRREYTRDGLSESALDPSPIAQFKKWFDEAQKVESIEANAMTLATVTADGTPDARIVLLKGLSGDAFVFFTNYQSAKGRQLLTNDAATLLFYWPTLERQVRIKGRTHKVGDRESDAYFDTRPIGSRQASIASPQSEVVENRAWLEQRVIEIEAQGDAQRPPHWGGYALKPFEIEFWQGRENRLHDRLRYRRNQDGSWRIERLAP